MLYTEEDVADYLRENDVKFVCLSFCDALGVAEEYLDHDFRAAPGVYDGDLV